MMSTTVTSVQGRKVAALGFPAGVLQSGKGADHDIRVRCKPVTNNAANFCFVRRSGL